MSTELKMPALSPTMEKGTIAKWLVKRGDVVKPGDIIAEIETDKATMELEAVDEGQIVDILIQAGPDDVAVGTAIALLAEEGEALAVADASLPPPPPRLQSEVAQAAAPAPIVSPPPVRRLSPAERIKVSPLAARIAEARRIDLADIKGTGPNGRITRADLGLEARAPAATLVAVRTEPVVAPPPDVPHEAVPLSNMRRTIARRLTEAKQTVPHFYLTTHVRIDALLDLRGRLNTSLAADGVKLSVNDLLIKAMARAMDAVPDANVQFGGDQLYRFSRVDIAMAVAIPGGLITPVITDVANKRLSRIATEAKALAGLARDNKLSPDQYSGGTASISNLGMFGIDEIFPVINPPQALILGVGAGHERPWVVDGQVVPATILAVTASFDHRAIDGAVAAQFMAELRRRIEEPILLLS